MLPTARPVVAVASSTGGAQVLVELMAALPPTQAGPLLIAQHLEPRFVAGFASWLEQSTGWPVLVVEPAQPAPLRAGVAYLPSPGCDLLVQAAPPCACAQPATSPLVPCADVLFTSAAQALGNALDAVVLSGLGEDGAAGLAAVLRCGGRALVQAPTSALMASMPTAALARVPGARALEPAQLAQALLGARVA